jgi:subtilisin family serine protease
VEPLYTQELNPKKYWLFFKDKGPGINEKITFSKNSASFQVAKAGITEKALQRRAKVLSPDKLMDFTDIPVNESYINEIQNRGIKPVNILKWFNAITVYLKDEDINKINSLEFIKEIRPVVIFNRKKDDLENPKISTDKLTFVKTQHKLSYGLSLFQNEFVNIPKVHDLGINGTDILVGLLDSGFRWKTHNSLKTRTVIKEYDFVFKDSITANDSNDVYNQDNHGTLTFSILGGYSYDNLIGPAYNSKFILAKTEDIRSETRIEEDNWAAAIEWMEGYGVDVTSTSLGYSNEHTNPVEDYTYKDMNGKTAIITKAADIAAMKGVAVVNSAGNEGNSSFQYISAPADGFYVIAVGATNSNGSKASFSSIGPTSDGRIKPDVSTLGVGVWGATAGTVNSYGSASGTSVSCPLIGGVAALILSARPELTPLQVRDALRNTASQANKPDNLLGWGIIDAYKAITYYGLVFSNQPEIDQKSNGLLITIYLASRCTIDKKSVRIYYAINSGSSYIPIEMTADSIFDNTNTGKYIGTIPTAGATKINFYFSATDSIGTRIHPYSPVPDLQRTFIYNFDTSISIEEPIPTRFNLYQNYPNPFNPFTSIAFQLSSHGFVSLKVYDVLGKEVFTLINEEKSEGYYRVIFDGSKLASGIYFYTIIVSPTANFNNSNNLFSDIKKLVLIK